MIERIIYTKDFLLSCNGLFTALVAVILLTNPVFKQPAFAQTPILSSITQTQKQENGIKPKAVSPEQQREFTKRSLTEAETERDRAPGATRGNSRQDAKDRYRLLDGLVTRLSSQLNLINEREELRRTKTAVEQKAKSWAGFPEPPPYSILMVDEIMGALLTARAKVHGLRTNQELFAQQVSQYRESAKHALEMERQAADQVERAQSPLERLTAMNKKELTGLQVRNAEAMAVSITLRHEVIGERLGIARVEAGLLERQLVEARKRMDFSRVDLNKALAHLKSSRFSLEQELEVSLARDVRSRSSLARTQQELNSFTLRHGAGEESATLVAQRNRLEARNRAALAWVDSSRFETEVVSSLITLNNSSASFWEQRYTAVTGKVAVKQRNILSEFRKSREQLEPWLEYTQQHLELYQAAEREQESRLNTINEQSPLHSAERDLLAVLHLQRQLAERQKYAVEQAVLERQSWLEDIERVQQSHSTLVRVTNWLGSFSDILRRVWSFELFAVEDTVEVAGQKVVTSRRVTVGKSVGALLLFLIGYAIAAFLARKVQRIMVTRFRIAEHQANVIRRWLLALTIFILLVITLNLARIPLTVFAFLGGALAIGIGIGTQTLIKNFISGILILLERNIKVGDTIDVEGVVGRVVTVDTRASTILGFDGVETVIPNSMFLENKVTNWTHTNSRLRRIVRVGVAYGSPVTQVRDILAGCGNEHGLILKDPPPEALFENFGDSTLIFALYFWINYGPEVNPLLVASDLRFMIDKRFAEANIVLAFPQRDIHLDSAQPLRVEIMHSQQFAPEQS